MTFVGPSGEPNGDVDAEDFWRSGTTHLVELDELWLRVSVSHGYEIKGQYLGPAQRHDIQRRIDTPHQRRLLSVIAQSLWVLGIRTVDLALNRYADQPIRHVRARFQQHLHHEKHDNTQ